MSEPYVVGRRVVHGKEQDVVIDQRTGRAEIICEDEFHAGEMAKLLNLIAKGVV